MRDEALSLRAAPVRTLPRPNRRWDEGRACAEDGCTTTLSIYNKSKHCWAHEPVRYFIARGRRRRTKAA